MIFNINYMENSIYIKNDYVTTLEIENKRYFFRLLNDLYNIYNGTLSDDIDTFDISGKEINLLSKINFVINYFDLDFNNKKNITEINKLVSNNIDDSNKREIQTIYKKLIVCIKKNISEIDLPLSTNECLDISDIIKSVKLSIDYKDNLLENLLLLIDIEKILRVNKITIFVNLKQYLTKQELIELYKYSLYNEVSILLIDSQSYGPNLQYEKKIIIDNNLEEYVL